MYDTIVIPTDGSEHAERAARRGVELADHHDAAVHAVSAAETGPLGDVKLPGDDASAADAIAERASQFVERVATLAAERELAVTTTVLEGPAGDRIVAYADDVGADLIVMGTRGRGGVERLMLGSVAENVVRVSDADVLVVHGDEEADSAEASDAAERADPADESTVDERAGPPE